MLKMNSELLIISLPKEKIKRVWDINPREIASK